jgi:hypothetical protein
MSRIKGDKHEVRKGNLMENRGKVSTHITSITFGTMRRGAKRDDETHLTTGVLERTQDPRPYMLGMKHE